MAKRKRQSQQTGEPVLDLRHEGVTRLNIPPAGLAARGQIVRERQVRYAYNPHLAPGLRFDATGGADRIAEIIKKAGRERLEPAELRILQEALRNHEPWLEWSSKREQQWCVADPVALHIHERVSAQAILRVARRQDVERSLFADPEYEYNEAVQFYKHPMDWANRMILGDSLAVMASLARREALAGKVQMIYMDPPYGIKYASNFQPEVGRRDVKDKDEDLTREPEMVKAYRDTWTLGVHSYLSYLRDRLLLCKELLADTGSVFVQISDENLHRVRCMMDEVFGVGNFVSVITFVKTTSATGEHLGAISDYILWYAKDINQLKFRRVYLTKELGEVGTSQYVYAESPTGETRRLGRENTVALDGWHVFAADNCTSSRPAGPNEAQEIVAFGHVFPRRKGSFKTNIDGFRRLEASGRLFPIGENLMYRRRINDFIVREVNNIWYDTLMTGFSEPKVYAVQTAEKVISRCLLMTTDPGDLVLDPTCGSGTTACVAEQWGRRWITIDVSRVALAITRQRLLTAKFDYYKLCPTSAQDVQRNPDGPWLTDPEGQIQGTCTFECKTVPHVTLKSIAQNHALDPIFAKWEPILADRLTALNEALAKTVTKELLDKLELKLDLKTKREGKKSVTDADRRRWLLPNPKSKIENQKWEHWQVPFDTDPDWPRPLQEALTEYRKAWRQKMDDINACIAARADQEELVDKPDLDRSKVRVSGPFTVEGVIPSEESVDLEPEQSPIGGAPDGLDTFGEGPIESDARNTEAYLDRMIRLIREDGVRFPGNKVMKFLTLEAMADGSTLHAKGMWANGDGGERQVAVMFGPQYGPLIAPMVEDGIRIAARRGFDDLVFAAFSFDGTAQAVIQEDPDPKLRIHMAQIRPDVTMGDLLKTTVSSQLFTVSGSPRTRVEAQADGRFLVHMEGVDIYDPVSNSVYSAGAEKVAAWFLDSDYDGRCFCICQAFFPDKDAWTRLGKALKGTLDEEAFSKLSGTVSLPFIQGEHKRIAIKVIDPRGNEVMRVHRLDQGYD